MLRRTLFVPAAVSILALPALAQTGSELAPERLAELSTTVARMARIGSAGSASFSLDGTWIAYTTNLSGMPQPRAGRPVRRRDARRAPRTHRASARPGSARRASTWTTANCGSTA